MQVLDGTATERRLEEWMSKVRWGVLGAAKIATEKVIPAMQGGEHSEIVAIASRSADRAAAVAAATAS